MRLYLVPIDTWSIPFIQVRCKVAESPSVQEVLQVTGVKMWRIAKDNELCRAQTLKIGVEHLIEIGPEPSIENVPGPEM